MEGARPVRAARGTTLTAGSWQTEAPLRMLMNNLDPEVAERPDDLVVYGGTGRAARSWRGVRRDGAHAHHAQGRRDDAGAVRQAGRRDAHPRVGPTGADRQLQPGRRLGHLAGVPPPGAARPDHVRADDGRLVDLHRHPGHPAGHLRDLRRRRRQALRRHAGRHAHPHRWLRRHGRRPAAGRDPQRRRLPDRRRRPGAAAASRRAPLPRRGGRRPRRRDRPLRSAPRPSAARCPSAWSATARRCCPELLRRGVAVDIVTDQTSAHDPLSYLPEGVELADWHDYAAAKPEEFTDRARASMAKHVEAMVGFMDAGAEVFDYGNSIRDEARLGGYERAFDFPGFVPAYIRPLFCEGKGPFRWAALSGDPKTSAPPTTRCWSCSPTTTTCTAGSARPRTRWPSRACPPASAGSATASGTRPACGSTTWSPAAGSAPDRHRPRPPRRRVGGLALPGDRVHGRRLRRHRRLAAAQRAGQHRVRRVLGVDPPRRRRRHRALASTPVRCAWRTAPSWPRRRSNGCSPTTRAWASSGTSTPATSIAEQVAARARGPHPDGRESTESTVSTFDAMWAELAPIGRRGRTPAATGASRGRGRTQRCANGSPPPAPRADSTSRPTAPATSGRGGATRMPRRRAAGRASSPDRIWTPYPTAGPSTARSGWCPRFAALDSLRSKGFAPARPIGVVNFGDEEGARFGVACAGSRAHHRSADARPGTGTHRRRWHDPRRGDVGRRAGPCAPRPRRRGPVADRDVRRAARRAGARSGRPRPTRRRRFLDLAARPVAARARGGGQPCGHYPAGRPARPDALRWRR